MDINKINKIIDDSLNKQEGKHESFHWWTHDPNT